MKTVVTALVLATASLATTAQAAIIDLDSLDIDFAWIIGTPVPDTMVALDVVDTNANILGSYTDTLPGITNTLIGPGPQILYTSDSNKNLNLMGPAAGTHAGGPAPSGTVDDMAGTITVDMSSWFANHGGMDQNLGGTAHGVWDETTGMYQMSWSAVLTQGASTGSMVTFVLNGTAIPDGGLAPPSAVPVPAAFWLMGSGLLGLIGVARRKA